MSNSTQIIHSIPVDPLTGSISTPIYQTATFVQQSPGVHKGYDYARSGNPTRTVLEQLVAELEQGTQAYAFATGLAAIDAVLKLLSAGDEIIAVDDIYGGAFRLFTHIYEKFGIRVHYCDTANAGNIPDLLSEKTKLIWLETPTNPTLKISDIRTIAGIAHSCGALLVVDNTFASPLIQKPLLLGADIVLHSGTKYLGGHSDLLAGLVIVKDEELGAQVKFIQNASGGILGPQDCWLLTRGIETLALRFEKQSRNAAKVAAYLLEHPAVHEVFYPGLSGHRNHEIALVQQGHLHGGIVSFSLKDDDIDTASSFVSSTRLFKLAESLGGVKSLVCQPSLMTHKSIPREKRLEAGVCDSLVRLSCGIEESADLLQDLEQAFQQIETIGSHADHFVNQ